MTISTDIAILEYSLDTLVFWIVVDITVFGVIFDLRSVVEEIESVILLIVVVIMTMIIVVIRVISDF